VAVDGDLQITLHYGGDPVFYPGATRRMEVSLQGAKAVKNAGVAIQAVAGWRVKRAAAESGFVFDITPDRVEASNVLKVEVDLGRRKCAADFVVLGPEAAQGFGAALNIERCRVCDGTKDSCVCMRK
jgi:hypothetical protein